MQKFAEKPKGKELDAMKVDTTVLGKSVISHVLMSLSICPANTVHTCNNISKLFNGVDLLQNYSAECRVSVNDNISIADSTAMVLHSEQLQKIKLTSLRSCSLEVPCILYL